MTVTRGGDTGRFADLHRRLLIGVAAGGVVLAGALGAEGASRATSGLQVLYDFRSPQGDVVKDRSGVGDPLDLTITDPKAVHRAEGSLEVRGKTLVRSEKPAAKIIDAVRESGELTLEAWIRPANTEQSGPARVITLSKDPNERNATLGQDKDRFEVRLRSTRTTGNGSPPSTRLPKARRKSSPTWCTPGNVPVARGSSSMASRPPSSDSKGTCPTGIGRSSWLWSTN